MVGFYSRQSWISQQYEQSRSTWHRFSRIQKSSIACSVMFLLIVGFLMSGSKTQTPNLISPTSNHPVAKSVAEARTAFSKQTELQSRSLSDATKQYKNRYGISPPPHFDKWYDFVERNGVPLVDEYDDIFEQLRPYWGISPAAIRNKVATAIATNDFIIGLHIRSGQITLTQHGDEWRGEAIEAAIKTFAELLPDMDIAFNRHDEPRAIIPYDQLAQMLDGARKHHALHSPKRTKWSKPPVDLDTVLEGQVKRSPFVDCHRPFTWPISTLSCPPDSPARLLNFDGTDGFDTNAAYTSEPLNFVMNRTAVTDICLQPSLKGIHSFFNSPNSWSITHDTIPIFSPSKPSTFHDILYPAPWYLGDKVSYVARQDMPWVEKQDVLYWRGSTTGGWSEHGLWKWQQRQRFVESVEKPGKGLVLRQTGFGDRSVQEVQRDDYRDWFDVHFYSIDFCSEDDCQAQKEYFDVKPWDHFRSNWNNKFLLDMDGHAFSGRFYAFLQSQSLILKQALFREWHEARLMPWVHYVPLGFNESDHLELLRFFKEEVEGQKIAQEIAEESTKWAGQSLRHVDMQAWIFRLLLEYARLIDDARDELGFWA